MCMTSFWTSFFVATMTSVAVAGVHAAEGNSKEGHAESLEVVVSLRDGSRLVGTLPVGLRIPLETSFGKLEIPLRLIAGIR